MFEGNNDMFANKNTKKLKVNKIQQLTLLLIAIVLSIGLFMVPFQEARANSTAQLEQEIKQLEAENGHSHDKVDALQLHANNLEDAIRKLQARINDLQAKIRANKAKSAQLKQEIKEAEIELAKQREVLGDNIRKMYVEGEISTMEMLVTSKDLSQFVDKQQYRNVVSDKIKKQLDAIEALKKKMAEQRAEIEAMIKEDEEMREEIADQKAEQNRLLAMNEAQQAEFNTQIKQNNKKIDELKKAQAEIAAALARRSYAVAPSGYVNGGDIIGRVGNTGMSTGPHLHLEARTSSGLANPWNYMKHTALEGAYVSQDYGAYNPWYISNYHSGIDFAGGDGNIRAIDGGNLYRGCSNDLLGTSNNAYGYVAIVEHANGVKSVYAHMSGGPAACNYNTF